MAINTDWIHRKCLILIIIRNNVGTDYNDVLRFFYKNVYDGKHRNSLQHKGSKEIYIFILYMTDKIYDKKCVPIYLRNYHS